MTLVAVPSSVIFFTTYEGLKHALGSTWIPQPAVHLVSSSIAQLLNCAVVTPAEVLKQNAQMLQREDRGRGRASPSAMVAKMVMKNPRSLWRGYTALVARDLPYTALQFPVFEYLKRTLRARREMYNSGNPAMGVLESGSIAAVSAAIAGSAAAWVTTPFDVIKTRMMLEVGAKHRDQHPRRGQGVGQGGGATHSGPLQICKLVMREEGVKGLFRGGLIRALFTMAGNGLFMGFYEGGKIYLGKQSIATG